MTTDRLRCFPEVCFIRRSFGICQPSQSLNIGFDNFAVSIGSPVADRKAVA